jgi:hypothetical protein
MLYAGLEVVGSKSRRHVDQAGAILRCDEGAGHHQSRRPILGEQDHLQRPLITEADQLCTRESPQSAQLRKRWCALV